ncbi:MAG: UDP-N-acetylmuramate:L-alanyl-gamma-D-glutamyl-meso-diaminopimelate ligase [Halieaceae bacterium]|nr:UDP-N-acetylmuramate:L-alanyl-gamma-D-glutamyl-meso-diaminopimelate ligase [Halieaceae bacterium]
MSQHIHILGICGTFMGGVALLARELGYSVSGSDANVYPPMSTQLEAAGIELMEGYHAEHLQPAPDLVVVGNAMSRGNPAVEYMLNAGIPYTSGPQWLGETLLAGRWVLAVAGTHGKTTTSSLLAWMLEYAGMAPGFLIGGVPLNFGLSARRGDSDFFVVEADEYDTAFFDKRSKFIHYRPRTLVAANLEFDHADIFPDLAAIERQFHHLFRCVPGQGLIVRGGGAALERVQSAGVWTPVQVVGSGEGVDWEWRSGDATCRDFEVRTPKGETVSVSWSQLGAHNASNAVMAMAAARHVGVAPVIAAQALSEFRGVKRRLELLGEPRGIQIYDDFAHHPTAIESTLAGLRTQTEGRLFAVVEPRSNTMRGGVHRDALAAATAAADAVIWYQPAGLDWSLESVIEAASNDARLFNDLSALIEHLVTTLAPGDRVVLMSNGSFGGVHQKLLDALASANTTNDGN